MEEHPIVATLFGKCAGGEGGDGVDHDDVNGGGAHQLIDEFEAHFTGVGLGNQEVLDVDAQGR